MKVTVIGQWGGFPKVNGASSGYLFQSDGFNLLVDCGSAVLSKLQQYISVEQLDAVILSHYHHDHVADIGPLQHARLVKRYMGVQQQTLPIYGHSLDEAEFSRLTHDSDTIGVAYNPDESLQLGPFEITFQRTKHPVPCFAMRITDGSSTVVYTGDSAYIEQFKTFAELADLFICECNFYANMDGSSAGHMNSVEAASIAKEANVETLLLTHLPHFGNVNDLVLQAKKIFAGNVILAEESLSWGN
ncbi:MBL fold metallo-hydrolase [Pueribacillus sp. YX66]|uniref:MBL fold metallo-hydrolase n=1 Tax=Pueribacillus sp. YX66 TaxID=3229242 RepID=UPI00358D1AAA